MNSVEKILEVAISKLKSVADVDTVVGKPVETPDGTLVLPISKVSIGFVAGGGEYSEVTLAGAKKSDKDFPFAGGSGAGVCISPVAFLSVHQGEPRLFLIDNKSPLEKIAEILPDVVKGLTQRFASSEKGKENKPKNQNKPATKKPKVKIGNAKG